MANLLLFSSRQSFHVQKHFFLRYDFFACLASVPSYGFQIPNNASLGERKFHCVGVYSFPAFAHVHKLSKSTCRRTCFVVAFKASGVQSAESAALRDQKKTDQLV